MEETMIVVCGPVIQNNSQMLNKGKINKQQKQMHTHMHTQAHMEKKKKR